jgi:membrane-bound serine protease (ClpP class)
MTLGILGVIIEVRTPGFGAPGLVGLACLGLFFWGHWLVRLAGWEELLLIAAGVLLLALEVFVLPGFGVAGVLGLAAVAAAMVLAMMGAAPTTGDVAQALAILGASLVITAAVVYAWLRHIPNSDRWGGLFLRGGMAQSEGYISAPPRADLVGQEGVAVTDLRPAGTAAIGSERVDVVTEGEFIAQGSPVRVLRSEGYRHVVRGVA